jgi:hypothetical protein
LINSEFSSIQNILKEEGLIKLGKNKGLAKVSRDIFFQNFEPGIFLYFGLLFMEKG